jgi:hypothetical protein
MKQLNTQEAKLITGGVYGTCVCKNHAPPPVTINGIKTPVYLGHEVFTFHYEENEAECRNECCIRMHATAYQWKDEIDQQC